MGASVGDRAQVDRRGVVDDDVDAAPVLGGGRDERVDLRLVAHVADDRQRLAACRLDLLARRCGSCRAASGAAGRSWPAARSARRRARARRRSPGRCRGCRRTSRRRGPREGMTSQGTYAVARSCAPATDRGHLLACRRCRPSRDSSSPTRSTRSRPAAFRSGAGAGSCGTARHSSPPAGAWRGRTPAGRCGSHASEFGHRLFGLPAPARDPRAGRGDLASRQRRAARDRRDQLHARAAGARAGEPARLGA